MVVPAPVPVLLDSDVLIGLIKSERIEILAKLHGYAFHVTDTNCDEVSVVSQAIVLQGALSAGVLSLSPLTDPAGLELFGRLRRVVDDGESATIAQAVVMGGRVAMHDAAGRRAAAGVPGIGRIYRLEDILVEAVRQGVLSLEEADEVANRLRALGDYRMAAAKHGFAAIWTDDRFGMGE